MTSLARRSGVDMGSVLLSELEPAAPVRRAVSLLRVSSVSVRVDISAVGSSIPNSRREPGKPCKKTKASSGAGASGFSSTQYPSVRPSGS